jgi:hypothetical protein
MKMPNIDFSAFKNIKASSPSFSGNSQMAKPQANPLQVSGDLTSPRVGGYAGAPGGKFNKIC